MDHGARPDRGDVTDRTGVVRRSLYACLLALGLASCSDGTAPVVSQATTLTLQPNSVSFSALGQTEQLSVTVLDQEGKRMNEAELTWESLAEVVATVTDAGLLTAVGNGVARVTVTSGSASASVTVTVQQAPESILLQPDSVVLSHPGDTTTLTATVFDPLGHVITAPSLTWTSGDDAIATVDSTGLVTAADAGSVLISVQAGPHTAQVSARVEPELTLVAAGPAAVSGEVATELALSVRVEDLGGAGYQGSTVTWSVGAGSGSITSSTETMSDHTGHAGAVWQLGTIAGPQEASASIESWGNVVTMHFTATAQPGAPTTAHLIADSILLSAKGETAFLAPTFQDAFGNPTGGAGLNWESRDPGVAMVASDGLVTGVGAGATYVVASFAAPSDSILVTVIMRGAITVTLDDGFVTAYTNGWPVFQEFGLVGNIGVNPARVGDPGDFPAYMTKSNLDELHAAGWSMVSHGMTHDTLTTLTAGELDWQLRASRQWIDDQGYRGSNIFLVPFHIWGARERDAIGQYYEATRGTPANLVSPDSLVPWRPSNPYELTGIEADDLPYTTVAGRNRLRALLQRTADEGAFLDVFFHHLPPENVDALRATLAVVNEFRERVLPYHELYPRFARSVY